MQIRWRLRMAAAQREVWTAAQLRRLLAERSGLHLSSASVSALFAKQPAQVKLETLARVVHCVGVHAQRPVRGGHHTRLRVADTPARGQARTQGRPRPLDAAAVTNYPACVDCAAPVKFRQPEPMSCLPSPRRPGHGQTSLPAVRAAAAPAAVGDVRGLRPRRGAPQAAQDDHLRALRRAATERRARPVQPLHSRRPGSTVPIRRLDGMPDGHRAGLVARAHGVRRRPLSPRWCDDDPSKNRPDPHRGADRERAADPAVAAYPSMSRPR